MRAQRKADSVHLGTVVGLLSTKHVTAEIYKNKKKR